MPTPSRPLRWLALAGAAGIVLAVLLALDLANHGLAWRLFWSLTGEETPAAQVRGMVEWLGNFTRPMPDTMPVTVIAHTVENPYGVNTFLEQEVEPAKREQQAQMIADAGFGWIRQEFPWEDIEIHGRGDFTDRRNVEAVGEISAWDKYDHIVDLAEDYGLQIQARLSSPPQWAQTSPDAGNFAPPADAQDFVNYAAAVAERYRGRIRYYQVWNEPNIYPEWGEQAVDPEAYTDLLCRTYAALKAVDPNIVVISGALAPTVALTGRDLNDFIFLQRMYDAGAGACFDILSMQGYGLHSGPTDQRMRPTTVNFSRNLYIRDLMVRNGDAGKPIWISEAAWSPVGEPDVPTDITGYGAYGRVTLEQAARYMPIAYRRVREEMPWVGVVNYWFFKRPGDAEKNQAFYYFRMVEPDFTPLPIYAAMQAYIESETPVLYLGIHQADDARAFQTSGHVVADDSAQLNAALRLEGGDTAAFTARGTHVAVRVRAEGSAEFEIRVDDQPVRTMRAVDEWTSIPVATSLLPETRTITLSVIGGGGALLLDSALVLNRTADNLIPLAGVTIGMTLVLLWVILSALRERRK